MAPANGNGMYSDHQYERLGCVCAVPTSKCHMKQTLCAVPTSSARAMPDCPGKTKEVSEN